MRSRHWKGRLQSLRKGLAITSQRINYGWGRVKLNDWPEAMIDGQWPPNEPEGLDLIAKRLRSGLTSASRAWRIVGERLLPLFPISSFEITESGFRLRRA